MKTIDIDQVVFDYSERWLPLTPDDNGPAVKLTPLDWTQYELARRLASIMGTQISNPRVMMGQLINLTNPTAWRGFVKNGKEIPYNKDLLFSVLTSNLDLGSVFDTKLKEWAEHAQQQEEDAAKNSDGGRGTPSTLPAKQTTEKSE